ncbi:unnamed protein product [Calypogeia fissa]
MADGRRLTTDGAGLARARQGLAGPERAGRQGCGLTFFKAQLYTALLFLWLAGRVGTGLSFVGRAGPGWDACAVSMYSIFIFVVRGERWGTGQTGRADRLGQDGQRGPVFVRGPVPEGEQTGRRRTTRRRNSSSAVHHVRSHNTV